MKIGTGDPLTREILQIYSQHNQVLEVEEAKKIEIVRVCSDRLGASLDHEG